MRISNENNELVLRIPLTQKSYDAAENYTGDVPNLVGVVAGREYSISHLIDLGYKDDIQEGSSVIMFDDEEQLREVCGQLGLNVWVYETCSKCKAALRGTHTWGENGAVHEECGV